jgi:glycosyltransferase involved in cell wall biosynthesis
MKLLSICIATKNRAQYCINAISSVLAKPWDDIELIVQDNSDDLYLKDYVASNFNDSRLIYNYTPPPFSSIDNFNAVVSLSSGEYICMIGDDDGVADQIMEVVRWAKANNIDSISPKTFSEYFWPETFGSAKDATLVIPAYSTSITKIDLETQLQNFFKNGALDYLRYGFPKLYHGIVKRAYMEAMKAKTGYFIGGLSPDIYTAIGLSTVVKNHSVLDFPVTIAGACKESTTIASINGQHSGELYKAPHFRSREFYKWDTQIPEVYSVETIWAESALKAVSELGRNDLRHMFNEDIFVARNLLRNTHKFKYFFGQTKTHFKKSGREKIRLFKLGMHISKYFTKYIYNRLFSSKQEKIDTGILITDVHNVKQASEIVSEKLGAGALIALS